MTCPCGGLYPLENLLLVSHVPYSICDVVGKAGTSTVVTRIPMLFDCMVGGVLTPTFGESSAFARQTDVRNGLSARN